MQRPSRARYPRADRSTGSNLHRSRQPAQSGTALIKALSKDTRADRWTFWLGSLALLTAFLVVFAWTPVASAQEVVSQGTWTEKGYAVDGDWKIVRQGKSLYLVLPASFSTKKAPDLKLFLSPKAPDQVTSRNATDGATLIAELENHRGAQRYRIDVDPSSFKTLVLHCEKYSKLWATAPLK